jgi:hypothetical protein
MSQWMKGATYQKVEAENYKEFFPPVKQHPDIMDYSRIEYEPNLRVSGELFSQIRFENVKEMGEKTGPVLLFSEFKPMFEWQRKEGSLEKIQLKTGFFYQFENDQNPTIKGDFKETKFYLDESFFKFHFDNSDFKIGNLIETLGAGDEISFLDTLNPRRLNLGLGTTSMRAKKAIPMVRGDIFINSNLKFQYHLIPAFVKSELADPRSVWATKLQKGILSLDPLRFTVTEENKDNDLENMQGHASINLSFDDYELRFHLFRLFESLPVIQRETPTDYTQRYPEDRYFAIDGNVTLFDEFLVRGEVAWHPNRMFSSLQNGVIGEMFESSQMQALIGVDHTLPNEFYFNIQYILSYISNFVTKTDRQGYGTEAMGTLRLRKSYLRDLLILHFQAVTNFTSGEYIIKPAVSSKPWDNFEVKLGYQLNDGETQIGPISQYGENNHIFFECILNF